MKSLIKPVAEVGDPIFDSVEMVPPVLIAVGSGTWENPSLLVAADRESVYSFHSCSATGCKDASHCLVNGREDKASIGGPYRLAKAFLRYSKPVGPSMSDSTSLIGALLISLLRVCQ